MISILWVDDEIDLLKPHIIYLEEKGYKITPVDSGNEAIELLDSIKFELEIQDTIRIKTAFLKDPVEDSLVIKKYTTGSLGLKNKLELESNLPVTSVDSSKLIITNIRVSTY